MYLCGVKGVEGGWGEGGEELDEHLHECAWRLTQWDDGSGYAGAQFLSTAASSLGARGYHHNLYNCVTSIKAGEINSLHKSLNEARLEN